jgi:transglutaminase-like putative cysteine protease
LRCERSVPLIGLLSVHPSCERDLRSSADIVCNRDVALSTFRDVFGNTCTRALAPMGVLTLSTDFLIQSPNVSELSGTAREVSVAELPDDVVQYLLASRYCETDKLSPLAWSLFGDITSGYDRVEAIVEYAYDRVSFGYEHASATQSAWESHQARHGVYRDRVHLAVAFCRCMNIPARYCCGYLCDLEVSPADNPMDFSAWLQVYLGDRWYTFDPGYAGKQSARVLMACGRDAADVAIYTTFGPSELVSFRVFAAKTD